MNSLLAMVLTNGGSDDGNSGQSLKRLGTVPEEIPDEPLDMTLSHPPPGNLESCSPKRIPFRRTIQSNYGREPEVDGTSEPVSQDTSEPGGFNQPIIVETGVHQPVRAKTDVSDSCKGAIVKTTKDPPHSDYTECLSGSEPVSTGISSKGHSTGMHIDRIPTGLILTTVTVDEDIEAMCVQGIEEPFHRMETEETDERGEEERDTSLKNNDIANTHSPIVFDTPLISNTDTAKTERVGGMREEKDNKGKIEESLVPLPLHPSVWHLRAERTGQERVWPWEAGQERREEEKGGKEEQVEVLDLSLPKKKRSGSKERRCGRFMGDAESSLLMEVDEVEGDGDRDIVEEDDGDDEEDSILRMDGADTFEGTLLSPSFFSTSVFSSFSSLDCDSENLLLIDDQGIPYTLTPDGHKVPQIDSSKSHDPPSDRRMVQSNSKELEENGVSDITTLGDTHLSQSLVNTPYTHNVISENPSAASSTKPSQNTELLKTTDLLKNVELLKNTEPPKVLEPDVKAINGACAVVSQVSGSATPIQILTNPSTNTPILLLPSSSSSSKLPSASQSKPEVNSSLLTYSLPLSLTQNSPVTSRPMFLLLSALPSSSGQSFSTSSPIAVINPSIGRISQITASSSSVGLSLSSGQINTLVSSLSSNHPHPVIRLTPNNPPMILSGVNNGSNPPTILTSPTVPSPTLTKHAVAKSETATLSSASHSQTDPNPSHPNPDLVTLSTDQTQTEHTQPSFVKKTSSPPLPHTQSPSLTFDPSDQPSPGAAAQSPAPESEPTSHNLGLEPLPLDDHLYFSSTAPPSPPLAPISNSGDLDPLDPLSPASSPSGPRRVLYCPLCSRVFYYLSDLERHSITHSQSKPHVCQQCGKAFKRSSHLQVTSAILYMHGLIVVWWFRGMTLQSI